MTTPAWIGLGSNLGDRKETLDAAIAALADTRGVDVLAVSSFHETQPVGGPPGQGAFLNAAARLDTTLDPHQLLRITQEIEVRFGRVRAQRWGERTLDIDLLIFGDQILDTPRLKLPHPRLAFRRFVLAPLAEIAPSVVETISKRPISDLLANLDRRPRALALEGPRVPLKTTVYRRLVEELTVNGIPADDPRPGRVEGSVPDRDEDDEREAGALRANRWAHENIRESWLVADDYLEFDRIGNDSNFPGAMIPEGISPQPSPRPIFAVLLADGEWRIRPGLLDLPLLRPESDDPDAIIAEVVATCRAIERS